ncbi:MAG TPA: hypothetical protein VEG34_13020, partial [Thermoanaerobaculia bacterium]|nr:hypothetical protein [Thermoanaerobaculia bacterium]
AAGRPIEFRICETPLFLSAELSARLIEAAHEVLTQVHTPEYRAASERAVPPGLAVPNEDAHTVFFQADFALVRGEGGEIEPRLIELQGFPSLYGFQWLMARAFREHFDIPEGWTPYFGGLDEHGYMRVLREVIVGDCDPENVVLLEIDPPRQKTWVDFACTERLLGIPPVSLTDVVERGGKLFYRAAGREVPIHRIYNRVIFDELEKKGLSREPLFTRPLDVTWVGHPNWFLKLSKFSLPFIRSRWAPEAHFVSDLRELPADLENYVLKPLFSFAGHGVEIGPTAERLRSLEHPESFILQRRVEYAGVVETPDGPAKAEVRMMFLWKDRPRLVNNLVRMSKGLMIGVDFNKDKTWIGASVAFHPPGV